MDIVHDAVAIMRVDFLAGWFVDRSGVGGGSWSQADNWHKKDRGNCSELSP